MTNSLASLVLSQLELCATGDLSADDLYVNLAPIVWGLGSLQGEKQTADLVNNALLLISEYDAGHRTEGDFRTSIASLCAYSNPTTTATNRIISYSSVDPHLTSGNGYAVAS
jgi:hypothetical protein